MTHIKLSLTSTSDPDIQYAVIQADSEPQLQYLIQLLPSFKATLIAQNNANKSIFIDLSESSVQDKASILSVSRKVTAYKALEASQEVPLYPTSCPLVENVRKG